MVMGIPAKMAAIVLTPGKGFPFGMKGHFYCDRMLGQDLEFGTNVLVPEHAIQSMDSYSFFGKQYGWNRLPGFSTEHYLLINVNLLIHVLLEVPKFNGVVHIKNGKLPQDGAS